VLSVAGMEQKFVFQGVGMLFSGGFSDTEWGPDEKRECRFVFIGRDLDKKLLIDGFMKCKCSENLRFAVGTKVLAKVGKHPLSDELGYCPGVVVKQWDEGNAYRIELEDKERTEVWGPVDEDPFVKAR